VEKSLAARPHEVHPTARGGAAPGKNKWGTLIREAGIKAE